MPKWFINKIFRCNIRNVDEQKLHRFYINIFHVKIVTSNALKRATGIDTL